MSNNIPGYGGQPFRPPQGFGGQPFPGPQQPLSSFPPAPPEPGQPAGAPGTGNANLRPQDVQAMLELGALKPQEETIARQRKIADQLRGSAMDQLKGQQVGRVFVAPNALQGLGSAASILAGADQDRLAREGTDLLGKSQADVARRWMGALNPKMTMPESVNTPGVAPVAGIGDWFKRTFGGGG